MVYSQAGEYPIILSSCVLQKDEDFFRSRLEIYNNLKMNNIREGPAILLFEEILLSLRLYRQVSLWEECGKRTLSTL